MNGQDNLTSVINAPIDPFSMVGAINRGATPQARGEAARTMQEPFLREESAARRQTMEEEQTQKQKAFDVQQKAETEFAKGLEREGEAFKEAVSMFPERKITEFDSEAAAELAGQTALISAFTGLFSGRAALKAMAGFTKGHQEGREDLYNQELKAYEAEVQKFREKANLAKTIYDNALRAETAKKGAGLVEAERLRQVFPDTLIDAKIRQDDLIGVGKVIDSMTKLANDLEVAKAKAVDKKKADLPSDLAKTYNQLAPNFQRFVRLNDEINPEYFGIIPNETAARLLMKAVEVDLTQASTEYIKDKFKVSEEQILWWKEYDQFVAKVRNELFGATLTRAEKENFDRTIITPATKPETAVKFFQAQTQIIQNAINREVQKGLSRGVDPEVINAYLGVTANQIPSAPPKADQDVQRIQQELTRLGVPYEPEKFTYGFENGRLFREPK